MFTVYLQHRDHPHKVLLAKCMTLDEAREQQQIGEWAHLSDRVTVWVDPVDEPPDEAAEKTIGSV